MNVIKKYSDRRMTPVLLACLWFLSTQTNANTEQSIAVAADINGDSIIHFSSDEKKTIPADLSTIEKPFLFWLNDDQDNIPLYESWPHDAPDLSNDTIDSLRDMEDFARLHVKLGEPIDAQSAYLEFNFLATSGKSEIQLWLSEDKEGRRGYILDEPSASAQLKSTKRSIGKVSAEKSLRIPIDSQLLQRVTNDRLCFLFEGVQAGQGALTVRIVSNSEGLQVTSSPFYIGLRPIKTFYERVGIDWPENIKAPWKYKLSQPPQPNLIWKVEEMEQPFRRPWYEDHNVIVWVHGWVPQDDENYRRTLIFSFETMWKRLWHLGYRGRIVHFRWPTLKKRNFIGMQESEYRAYKSAPVLRYADDVGMRKAIHRQLNKGEAGNKRDRALAIGRADYVQTIKEDQKIAETCKRLLKNVIVCWNFMYLSKRLSEAKTDVEYSLLLKKIKASSMQAWEHFVFHGEFDFSQNSLKDSQHIDLQKILDPDLIKE